MRLPGTITSNSRRQTWGKIGLAKWMETFRKLFQPQFETGMEYGDVQPRVGAAEGYGIGPNDGVRVDMGPRANGMDGDDDPEITVGYNGLLAQAGAASVVLHCGDGPGDWENVRNVAMEPGPTGEWIVRVRGEKGRTLAFCFHDNAGNWDNNSGLNWSVTVE